MSDNSYDELVEIILDRIKIENRDTLIDELFGNVLDSEKLVKLKNDLTEIIVFKNIMSNDAAFKATVKKILEKYKIG